MMKTNRIVPSALCLVLCALCLVPCAGAAGAADVAKDGGLVKVAGKGRIALVDCASGMDWAAMKPAFDSFDESFHIEVVRLKGEPFAIESAGEAMRKTGANAALFVCDKPGYPMSLNAPEEKWAFINLAPLKAAKKNLAKRCQCLLTRGIYRALGSDASKAGKTALYPVFTPEDLDKIEDFGVAMDTYIAIHEACDILGIESTMYLTFREACELENPPTPTNDVQRAIAAEVKAAMQKQKK